MTQSEIIERTNALNSEKLTLESKLSSDDYKTIKNAEAQAAGKPLPYDPDELHTKHQAWRDRINTIEDEIEELNKEEPEPLPEEPEAPANDEE
jgi:predicted  nucleic acid-binding Zn-ribbon protein